MQNVSCIGKNGVFVQEIIDSTVLELIRIIESKQDSKKVAWQFVLEELDAAKDGSEFTQDRIKSFYINSSDYIGAMSRSWYDVDGLGGPQQFLLSFAMTLSERVGVENAAAVRISIVEYIVHHYKFGRYAPAILANSKLPSSALLTSRSNNGSTELQKVFFSLIPLSDNFSKSLYLLST